MWRGVGTISLRACGGDSPLIEKSKDIAEPHSEGQTRNLFAAGYEQKPGGVGGWLALFCVTLMLFGPFTYLRIAAKALINLARHPIGLPTEFRLASVAVVYAGVAVFSALRAIAYGDRSRVLRSLLRT